MSCVLLVTQGQKHYNNNKMYHCPWLQDSLLLPSPFHLLRSNKLPTLLLSQQFATRPSLFCACGPSVVQHTAALRGKRIVNRQQLINHITQRSHQPSSHLSLCLSCSYRPSVPITAMNTWCISKRTTERLRNVLSQARAVTLSIDTPANVSGQRVSLLVKQHFLSFSDFEWGWWCLMWDTYTVCCVSSHFCSYFQEKSAAFDF